MAVKKKKKATRKTQSTETESSSYTPLITIIVLGVIVFIGGFIMYKFPTIVSTIIGIYIGIGFLIAIIAKFKEDYVDDFLSKLAETFQDLSNIINNELASYLSFVSIPVVLSIGLAYFQISIFNFFINNNNSEFFFQYKAITNYVLIFSIWYAFSNIILIKEKNSKYALGIIFNNIINVLVNNFSLVIKEIITSLGNGALRLILAFLILQFTLIFIVIPIIMAILVIGDSVVEQSGNMFALLLMKAIYLYIVPVSIYCSVIYWTNKSYLNLGKKNIVIDT